MPHIQDGKLAALAVTGERRMPKMPDVPTVQGGRPSSTTPPRSGFSCSARRESPEPVLTALNKEFIAALDDKEVRERLTGFGLEVTEGRDNTAADLKKHIDDFATTYGKLIAEHGHQGRVGIETAGKSRPLEVTCLALDYSTLAPENSTTFFHFAVSDAMILPKSCGRAAHRRAAEIGEPRLDLRIGQRLFDRAC